MERSVQRLYPLGVFASRLIALAAMAFALLYAVAMTWANRADIVSWPLAAIAVGLVAASAVVVVRASRLMRVALGPRPALAAVVLADAAMLLASLSMFGHDSRIRDDWGPFVVGVTIIALAAYRSAGELVRLGGFSAVLAGFLGLLDIPAASVSVPPVLVLIVSVLPIVLPTLLCAVFVSEFTRDVMRWRRRSRPVIELPDTDTAWIARSVQQDAVTVLNRDVVPFLTRIAEQGVVGPTDAEAARAISSSLRAVLVAEVDRSWLTALVEAAAPDAVVIDPERLADRMTLDERACLRAAFAALVRHPGFSGPGFRVEFVAQGDRIIGSVSTVLVARTLDARQLLAPYYAVLRLVFPDLQVTYSGSLLTLGFSYEGRRS